MQFKAVVLLLWSGGECSTRTCRASLLFWSPVSNEPIRAAMGVRVLSGVRCLCCAAN